MKKCKVVMIGPCQAGKSTIANFLSDAIDYVSEEYRPTKALRILEFEIKNSMVEVEVELWDCSGDLKYENLWNAFLHGAHGVVLVYNPENTEQVIELDKFYNYFVTHSTLPNTSVLILAHYRDPEFRHTPPDLENNTSKVSQISANVLENGEDVESSFEKFVASIMSDAKEFDQDDFSILNMSI